MTETISLNARACQVRRFSSKNDSFARDTASLAVIKLPPHVCDTPAIEYVVSSMAWSFVFLQAIAAIHHHQLACDIAGTR